MVMLYTILCFWPPRPIGLRCLKPTGWFCDTICLREHTYTHTLTHTHTHTYTHTYTYDTHTHTRIICQHINIVQLHNSHFVLTITYYRWHNVIKCDKFLYMVFIKYHCVTCVCLVMHLFVYVISCILIVICCYVW